ncbi:tRNA lysidine(34) synthetase TilS [Enterobacteriaceae endosymbiont of Donacia versicolorea]|uniref:tRNA lysidine(34) synthetase TilS n=1 Tax=Enterobacteriaceae endosymbiont of Donacia versicolorea TaxID=2675788 RepID=UPI00144A2974|nr:tRNA lysidine(34) synthetase TilS [Enterobacteriaceae endosymbiont of Donacia versicolorea]QJC32083.1 tRNA lysidine(34) synthetase TilS [Enterobacteriaceae endosymbiont of Donacia versicolorea]
MLITNETQLILYKFKKILIAYSGGIDSTVLLYNLIQLKKKYQIILRVIHINHNLNVLSNNWLKTCMLQCKKWNVLFIKKNIEIKKTNNIEKYARIKRYKIFQNILKKDEVLVTAHNLDDQCETFLLSLKRGSGPKGLSGMSKITILNNIKLFRPFLEITRHQIYKYAIKKKLNWIEDPSNKDIKYDRNFLRNVILPKITNRWSFFKNSVYRSSIICKEQEKLLTDLINPILKKLIQKNNSLLITPLYKFSIIKRNFILRKWIEYNKFYYMPSRKMLFIIWNEVICCKHNKNPQIKIGKYIIRKYKDYLYCVKYFDNLQNILFKWDNLNIPFVLPNKLGKLIILNININYKNLSIYIRKPKIYEIIYIKFNISGKYYLNNFKYKKNINDIWKNLLIPKWKREQIPLLFYNNKFIADLENNLITQEGKASFNKKNNFFIFWEKKY